MLPRSERPGLAKVRRVRLVRSRVLALVTLEGGAMALRLAEASVISEGAMQGDRYFGTTDIAIPVDEIERDEVAAVLSRDPHVRLRAIRLARREACGRAEGSLDTLRAEVTVSVDARGVRIRVDVEAAAHHTHRETTLHA